MYSLKSLSFELPIVVCSQLTRKIEALVWLIMTSAMDVVLDIQHVERMGRRRDNTWARPGDKVAQCCSRNMMEVRNTNAPP
jgi:hypothetical protein